MMAELVTQFDPLVGASALGQFQRAPDSGPAFLSGRNLREGLLASLWSAELLAAQAGIVPFFQIPGGQRGVAVLGAARARIDQAPEAVRVIYLAAHGAARRAQGHAREAGRVGPSDRTDSELAKVQNAASLSLPGGLSLPLPVSIGVPNELVDIGDLGVTAIVLTVIGVAAVVATAWFAKGVVEKIVETRAEDLRASYAADTAAKLAMASIAAGQPVDPGVWEILKGVASREKQDTVLAPILLGGGAAVALGAAVWAGWRHYAA